MRTVLWLGGFVLFGAVILIVAPSFVIQNSGSATLVATHSGDIKGTATLTPLQGGQITIINVQLQRLEPFTTYALSIHAGSCFGKLLTALQPATTDGKGSGFSSTTLGAPIQSSWFIVLHNGKSTRNAVLACGQVVLTQIITPTQPSTTNPNIPSLQLTPSEPGQFPNTGGGPPQEP